MHCAIPERHTVKRLLVALLLALAACVAEAQTVTTSIPVSWTAPTTNTDGTAITGTLTYQLYQGVKGGAFTAVGTPVSALTVTVTSATAGACFTVVAIETIGSAVTDSTPSNTLCAEIPGSPGGLTLTWSQTVH